MNLTDHVEGSRVAEEVLRAIRVQYPGDAGSMARMRAMERAYDWACAQSRPRAAGAGLCYPTAETGRWSITARVLEGQLPI